MSNAQKQAKSSDVAITPGRPGSDKDADANGDGSGQARKREADGIKTATIEFRGHQFTIPLEYDDFPVDLIESLEEGKVVGIIRGALGRRQWRLVQQMNLRIKDLSPLMDQITQAMGFTSEGESEASSD